MTARVLLFFVVALAACGDGLPCEELPSYGIPGGPCLFGECAEGTACLEWGGSICAPLPRPTAPVCGSLTLLGEVCVHACDDDLDCPLEGMRCAELGACVWAICQEER